MLERLLHVLYAIEFLIALIAVYTVWSEVGGQGHLDYMAWYWKAAMGPPAAYGIIRLTQAAVRRGLVLPVLGESDYANVGERRSERLSHLHCVLAIANFNRRDFWCIRIHQPDHIRRRGPVLRPVK